ncbi:MAG: 5'/3'-nucleotidase SurE [Bacteroidales bacterium]|nr:5'/3'-nucleotidase SurE [Candidatus Liminaster caballi]
METKDHFTSQAAANMSQANGSMSFFPEPTGYGQIADDAAHRPTILITNDDGYQAPGINHLIESLRGLARIVVCAPDSPRSGFSASFTCTRPVTLRRVSQDADVTVYACSGTPVDCVKLALHRFFSRKEPDLIVSGVNHGGNDSICIMYSGTMGAVLEGCVVRIPAIGFSLLDHRQSADFTAARPYLRSITKAVLDRCLAGRWPEAVGLNINIPASDHINGVRVCRQAEGYWWKEFHFIEGDENEGEAVFQVTGEYANREASATDTDRYWLEHDCISVVPVGVDYTHHPSLGTFPELNV